MNDTNIGDFLTHYLEALEAAATVAPAACRDHLRTARCLAVRWLRAESPAYLKTALQSEWESYLQGTKLPSAEAFTVGWTFGALCRVVGVDLSPSPGDSEDSEWNWN
jgi:hypothetical protein